MAQDSGQAGTLPLEFRQGYDSIVGDYRQALQRIDDTLVLKGLSLAKAYIEGRARVAVVLRTKSTIKADCANLIAVWNFKGDALEPSSCSNAVAINNFDMLDLHRGVRSNQAVMLVSDVKSVNSVNFIPINLERLYLVEDEFDDIGAREGSCFLSIDGRFRVLPRVAKRELCPFIDGAAIGLDQCAVSVVKGSAKVVDGVTDDRWCMSRDASAEGALSPFLRVGLGAKGFDIVHHVSSDDCIELLDVMVGPFYF